MTYRKTWAQVWAHDSRLSWEEISTVLAVHAGLKRAMHDPPCPWCDTRSPNPDPGTSPGSSHSKEEA